MERSLQPYTEFTGGYQSPQLYERPGVMNFSTDLEHLVQKELSALGYAGKPKDDLDTLLLRYHNVVARIPRRVSWDVKVSDEVSAKLSKKLLKAGEDQGLRQFIQDAKAGKDLRPYLSDNIEHPEFRDLMFYDWGIHHFHLSTAQDPKHPGFVKRTDQLLFAVTDSADDAMYLIDVRPHEKAFASADLLRLLENNWPDVLDPFTLKGIETTGSGLPSEQEVHENRKVGLTPIIKTPSGRSLAPMGGGVTTAGTRIENRRAADQDYRTIKNLQAYIESAKPQLERHFREQHNLRWENLEIHLTRFFSSITVTERNTATVLYPAQSGVSTSTGLSAK